MTTTRPAIWTYYRPSPFVRPMAAAAAGADRHKWTKNLGRQERREGLAVTINISHSSFSPPGELETGKKDRSFRPPRPVFSLPSAVCKATNIKHEKKGCKGTSYKKFC